MSDRTARSSKALSVDHKRPPGCSGCFLRAFFSVFLIAGLAAGYFMAVRPIGQIIAARDWHETPCTVRSSELAEQRGDDSTSYVIRITYDYLYDAQPYTGERYHFGDIASNTSPKWKRRVVADHPAGHRTVCYVNPGDPAEAVLHRGPTRELWWGLFPLPFLAVGIGGVFFGHRLVETKPAGSTSPASSTQGLTGQPAGGAEAGPLTLKPQTTAGTVFVVTLLACLFWNGITGMFVAQIVDSFLEGDPEWFLTLFMTPFVLIGLVLAGASGYTFLKLFNPRPELTLDRAVAPLGGLLQVRWQFRGNVGRIRNFKLSLKGEEKATYRRGTDTHTDTETFFEHVFYEADHPAHIAAGEAEFEVPGDSMHSFAAPNNEIVWSLYVHGDIPAWPDVDLSFPIEVTPHEPSADPDA